MMLKCSNFLNKTGNYYQICQRIKTGSWFVGHVANEGSYITKDDQWASFNDVVDVEEKSRWIKNSGLGGASVFGLHEEDSEDVCGCGRQPLVKTVNRIFERLVLSDSEIKNCSLI